jgi:ribosome modulation factor
MGRACRIGKIRNAHKILVGKPGGGDNSEDLRCRGKYQNGSSGMSVGGCEWTHLTQDRSRWRALVNTVMNFVFYERGLIS